MHPFQLKVKVKTRENQIQRSMAWDGRTCCRPETELQLSNSKPRILGPAKSVAKVVGATSSEGTVAIAVMR